MAAAAIRVEGLQELGRTFKRMEKTTAKTMRDGLRGAGRIVAEDATSRESRYPGLSGFTSRIGRGTSVEVKRRRSTGTRGDFGALLMRRVLLPAQRAREDEVVRALEEMLGRWAAREGF